MQANGTTTPIEEHLETALEITENDAVTYHRRDSRKRIVSTESAAERMGSRPCRPERSVVSGPTEPTSFPAVAATIRYHGSSRSSREGASRDRRRTRPVSTSHMLTR